MGINFESVAPMLALSSREYKTRPSDHFVEFYEEDSYLVDTVARYVATGVTAGEAAIVVANEAHARALEEALTSAGADVGTAREEGLLISLDATETLAVFMQNGVPSPTIFEEYVGGLIDSASAGGKNVRIFGEMVAVLWAEGNVTAALQLEDLWNDLAKTHAFRLFCGYPISALGGGNLGPLRSVCQRHTHVIAAAQTSL